MNVIAAVFAVGVAVLAGVWWWGPPQPRWNRTWHLASIVLIGSIALVSALLGETAIAVVIGLWGVVEIAILVNPDPRHRHG